MRPTAMSATARLATRCMLLLGLPAALLAFDVLAATPAASQTRTVTLITGDRVTITSGERRSVNVQPRNGREGIQFLSHGGLPTAGKSDALYVIPADAMQLISSGQLDRELFNVTLLLESNYDDAKRNDLPLIVTYQPQAGASSSARATASAALTGATVTRRLDMVNGVAAKAQKQQIGALWDNMTGGASTPTASAATLSRSVKKIWLDRLLKPVLDRSVPQVGAPTAWASGYDGNGVVVAVIDTGVDASHPDLVGKVVADRNFTEDFTDEPGGDSVGHGTHVASTIAGSGAASGGKYRGVAPGVRIVSGKVCFSSGCPTSSIIAGMQWAVTEEGAKIVNMSLGGPDEPEIDPMEETVNQLTAQYGALFVISAGNSGPSPYTVGSPASADAALAVGAIDRAGQTATFSSRGPRLADKAIKPEITAPGVGIVAARASGTQLGSPVGDSYVALSGTSMAAPHVAGAAALLSQLHPQWSPEQLKATLTGSAQFNISASVYDQGAGRVDIPAAFAATVLVDASGDLGSLGTVLWPHEDDEAITRVVTYRNLSADTNTLSLRFEVAGPDGRAAPPQMFVVSPATLSIAAGGTASTTVTVNTRVSGANGLYGGRLIATNAAGSIAIPLAIEREVESYDLLVKHFNHQGAAPRGYFTEFFPLDGPIYPRPLFLCCGRSTGPSEDLALRLPAGRYSAMSVFSTQVPASPQPLDTTAFLVKPLHRVSAPETLTFDARHTTPLLVSPPTPTSERFYMQLGLVMTADWGAMTGFEGFTPGSDAPAFYVATLGEPAKNVVSKLHAQWKDARQQPDSMNYSKVYAALWIEQGKFLRGTQQMRLDKAAVVDATYALPSASLTQNRIGASPFRSLQDRGFIFFPLLPVTLPVQRTEYYYSSTGNALWSNELRPSTGGLGEEPAVLDRYEAFMPPRRYHAGRHYSSRWNTPPFAPAFPEYPPLLWAYRTGNVLTVSTPLFGDRTGHAGGLVKITDEDGYVELMHQELYRNGQKIGEVDLPGGLGRQTRFSVDPEVATYRLEASQTQSLMSLSKRVSAAWTFQSERTDTNAPAQLPLLTVSLKPRLNHRGEAVRGSHFQIPVFVHQLGGGPGPVIVRSLTLDASFDDGATWKPTAVKCKDDRCIATLQHPKRANYVSLRAVAQDFSGNAVEETVIRAYGLSNP